MKNRFLPNVVSNIVNMLVGIVAGLLFVPFLIKQLGVSAYGFIPLTSNLSSYLTLVALALNAAVGRFILMATEQGDTDRANRIFNTSLWASMIMGSVMLLAGLILTVIADKVIVVPKGQEAQIQWLLLGSVTVVVMTTISTPFQVSTYCRNRLDIGNAINVIRQLVYLFSIVALFYSFKPRLSHIAVGLILSSAVMLAGTVVVSRFLMPFLRPNIRKFSWTTLKELVSTGGWVVVDQVGHLLLMSVDLIIINRLLGPKTGGEYASVLPWSTLMYVLGGTIASPFGPPSLSMYAKGDMQGVRSYSLKAVRALSIVMPIPVGLIIGFGGPILHIWLGAEFAALKWLLALLMLKLAFVLPVLPLFNLQVAAKQVKLPALMTCICGVFSFVAALFFVKVMHWGMYGVAAAGAIAFSIRNFAFTPAYVARIIGGPKSFYYKSVFLSITSTGFIGAMALGLAQLYKLTVIYYLIGCSVIVSIIYCVTICIFVLTREERSQIWSTLCRLFHSG